MFIRHRSSVGVVVCALAAGGITRPDPQPQKVKPLDPQPPALTPDRVKDLLGVVDKKLDAEVKDLVALYQYIHTNPELSLSETKTAARLAEEVRKLAAQAAQAATSTSDTVRVVLERVQSARQRLIRLGAGGMAARDAAHAAAAGLLSVANDADANDQWTRRISASADEVRGLIEQIAGRMREVSAGTEDYAAAAQEIAAAAEQLNASTEEISSSASTLAGSADKLTQATSHIRL